MMTDLVLNDEFVTDQMYSSRFCIFLQMEVWSLCFIVLCQFRKM